MGVASGAPGKVYRQARAPTHKHIVREAGTAEWLYGLQAWLKVGFLPWNRIQILNYDFKANEYKILLLYALVEEIKRCEE